MNILITGGAGFIGSHLAKAFTKKNHQVVILDNFDTGKRRNLEEIKHNLTIVKGSILDKKIVQAIIPDIDVVFHLAAKVTVQDATSKEEYKKTNVQGTKNILEASYENAVKKFIFISTAAVYGDANTLPICESTPTRPISYLGKTKLKAERICEEFHKKGLTTIILRLFNVYGPNQNLEYSSLISTLSDNFTNKNPSIIYGDGNQTRDFIHVKDVTKVANFILLNNTLEHVFNIGSGKEYTVNEIYNMFKKSTKKVIKPLYHQKRNFEIERSYACICRAKKVLHFNPTIEMSKGIKDLIKSSVPIHI